MKDNICRDISTQLLQIECTINAIEHLYKEKKFNEVVALELQKKLDGCCTYLWILSRKQYSEYGTIGSKLIDNSDLLTHISYTMLKSFEDKDYENVVSLITKSGSPIKQIRSLLE